MLEAKGVQHFSSDTSLRISRRLTVQSPGPRSVEKSERFNEPMNSPTAMLKHRPGNVGALAHKASGFRDGSFLIAVVALHAFRALSTPSAPRHTRRRCPQLQSGRAVVCGTDDLPTTIGRSATFKSERERFDRRRSQYDSQQTAPLSEAYGHRIKSSKVSARSANLWTNVQRAFIALPRLARSSRK